MLVESKTHTYLWQVGTGRRRTAARRDALRRRFAQEKTALLILQKMENDFLGVSLEA